MQIKDALHDRVAAKILAARAAAHPERPFVFFAGQWLTYGQADLRANRVAHALLSLGVGKGSRVALLMRNRLEFLDLWFALGRVGAIQVPLNPEYLVPQIEHVLRRAPIDVVVAESDLLAQLLPALAGVERRPLLVVCEAQTLPAGARRYEDALRDAPDTPPPGCEGVSGTDPGAVMNTSGTTGPSKGVLLSHAQQYLLGHLIASDIALREDDCFYNFFPLFHNTAQAMITIPVLLAGARMVLTPRFSVSRFWPDIIEHRCTCFYFIGEIMRMLLMSTSQADARGAALRVGWGIGATAPDMEQFASRFGVDLRTGYGSTEANVPCYLPAGSKRWDTAGQCIAGFELRIADERGVAVPAGTQGEILLRADEPCALMLGYDGDPAATVAAWQHLWFHTGDAGILDAQGYLHFKGRIKDSIRVRGENISAFEVEEALAQHSGVAEAAAIAVPSELGGDDLMVVVVRRPGAELTAPELISHARARLPRYSVPRYVAFVDALPKTPTNKVQKHVLRAQGVSPSTWDRHSVEKERA